MLFGFVQLAHLNVGHTDVFVCALVFGVQGKGLFVRHERFVVFFLVSQAETQQIETISATWVGRGVGLEHGLRARPVFACNGYFGFFKFGIARTRWTGRTGVSGIS